MTSNSELNPDRWLSALKRPFWPYVQALADLRLAIALLLLIALTSVSGTVIEQGRSLSFYQENYPEDPALFGFLTWRVLLLLGLDQVYTTWWFVSLLVIFGSSLTACTFTRQLPTLKSSRRWSYYDKPRNFRKLALSTELDRGSLEQLAPLLAERNYKLFREENKLYARKGIAGRVGPILVHASILVILGGSIWGSFAGFTAQEMVPSGNSFRIQNIVELGPLGRSQIPNDWGVQVNRFWIDYTPEGRIDQFYSDLSVVDRSGEESDRQTISVNHPLRHKGVTIYQTDWGISAVKIQLNNSPVLKLPMAPLNIPEGGRLWGTWIPTKPDLSEGVSLVTRDLQGTLVAYDNDGELAGAVSGNSPLAINGITLKIVDLLGSTGLQIKSDPGIPFVYAGFALLMLGVAMSYVSHSQIWALETGDRLYIGGKTNRAHVAFERELLEAIALAAPEVKS